MFLEALVTLSPLCSLRDLSDLRPTMNKSYEANLDQVAAWLALISTGDEFTHELSCMTKHMLSPDRGMRPKAKALVVRLASLNVDAGSLHCQRCRQWFDRDPDQSL